MSAAWSAVLPSTPTETPDWLQSESIEEFVDLLNRSVSTDRRAVVTGPDGEGAIVVRRMDGWVIGGLGNPVSRTVILLRSRLVSPRKEP